MSEVAPAFDIAASGMAAARLDMDLIAGNLAHADTVDSSGTPYRPRYAVFESGQPFAQAFNDAVEGDIAISLDGDQTAPEGVQLASIVEGQQDSAGGVDSITQMVKLVAAGRDYDANVSALQSAKQMDLEAADIDRP